jgi:hypothetical protein
MSATVYDAILGGLTLRQVMRTAYSPNANIIAGRVSGGLNPSEFYGGPAEPMASFDSADLAGVLGGLSVTAGLSVAAGTITIPFNERANGGTFASGSNHETLSSANGLIVPTSFSANQDDAAAIATLECHFRSTDGLTYPVAVNANQALGSQAFSAQFAMGPVGLELGSEGSASLLDGVSAIAVNPGLTVVKEKYNGAIYPTRLFITQRDPSIDITFVDLAGLVRFTSIYQSLVSLAVFFRKRADGGSFVSDATEEHIAFSFAAGITQIQQVGASGNATGSHTVRLYGKALTASAAAAIAL